MAKLISASICLSDIDKSKITVAKNGKKYLDITLSVNDEKDNYGNDTGIYHTQTKEERERKDKKVYLGNGKTVWSSEAPTSDQKVDDKDADFSDKIDDLPF